MATISSAGIGSGLNVEDIITQMMKLEQTPITQLQQASAGLQTKISSYGQVQSYLSALQEAARKLNNPDSWTAASATSSDTTAVSVSATSAAVGSYSISVSKLAAAQSITTSAHYADSSAVIGQGTLTIELGAYDTNNAFTAKAGKTPVVLSIGPGEQTLAGLRDKINASNAGVTASIVTDANGSRLALRSTATGETNGFRITVGDSDGNDSDTGGLSALAYDPSNAITTATLNQAASNAQATVGGITLSSETNTLSNSIDGLTINLLKTTSSPVTVGVNTDTTSIKKLITDFATSYNNVISYLRDQTKYDAATKTAGTLQGDSRINGVQAALRGILGGTSTLGGTLTRMADIGLEPDQSGKLVVKDSKLTAALGKLDDLKKVFSAVDTTNATNSGFAQRLLTFTTAALGSDGVISNGTSGLQKRVKDNTNRIDSLNDRLALVEKRMRDQYTALDTKMGSLNSLANYVNQQYGNKS